MNTNTNTTNDVLSENLLFCGNCRSSEFKVHKIRYKDLHTTVHFKIICLKCNIESILINPYVLSNKLIEHIDDLREEK